jgi:autotransporter translocation and assembly factor TamB
VLELSQTAPTELRPRLTVTANEIGNVTAQADLAVPERWLDPAAWRRLGRGALHSASLRAEDITIDPAMLDRLGIVTALRGRIGFAVDVGQAARTVDASVDVRELRGGPINQPVDLRFTAQAGDRATTASFTAASKGGRLLELTSRIPISLADLLDRYPGLRGDPAAIRDTRLAATAKLASVDAARLLAVFGRTEVTSGQLDGSVDLAGTLGRPTVTAQLVATQLKVPPGPRGKPVRTVERLAITAGWDGETARLDIDGVESEGGTLQVAAVARPSALRDGTLTVKATKFDLVPVLVFAPGPAGGASGELDADLKLTGLDPRTAQIAGQLHLREARIPIAPAVGTLRSAKIDVAIADHSMQLAIDGKLGAGTVKVTGSAALDGAAPNGGKATITLRKVSPIGAVEPQVSANIAASLSRERDQWHADLVVNNASVDVPSTRGEKLKPVGAPTDMLFANGARMTRRPMAKEEPVDPIFLVTINLRSTRVESQEFRGDVSGKLEIRADGEAVAVTGGIEAVRGDLDLFGQRYYVERAGVYFDGSTDPLLDIRITHDFPDVTTVTEVRGRLSAPELMMTSDPGTYSQGQLLGFLLGGQPGGDPAGSSADRATSAGESYVANQIGGYVRKSLPINLDVLRYEAATSSSSAAVTVGTWLSDSLFLAYRQHLEARPDQNTGEGEIEYWLTKRLVIEGTAGNRNVDGLDLLWRKRY